MALLNNINGILRSDLENTENAKHYCLQYNKLAALMGFLSGLIVIMWRNQFVSVATTRNVP